MIILAWVKELFKECSQTSEGMSLLVQRFNTIFPQGDRMSIRSIIEPIGPNKLWVLFFYFIYYSRDYYFSSTGCKECKAIYYVGAYKRDHKKLQQNKINIAYHQAKQEVKENCKKILRENEFKQYKSILKKEIETHNLQCTSAQNEALLLKFLILAKINQTLGVFFQLLENQYLLRIMDHPHPDVLHDMMDQLIKENLFTPNNCNEVMRFILGIDLSIIHKTLNPDCGTINWMTLCADSGGHLFPFHRDFIERGSHNILLNQCAIEDWSYILKEQMQNSIQDQDQIDRVVHKQREIDCVISILYHGIDRQQFNHDVFKKCREEDQNNLDFQLLKRFINSFLHQGGFIFVSYATLMSWFGLDMQPKLADIHPTVTFYRHALTYNRQTKKLEIKLDLDMSFLSVIANAGPVQVAQAKVIYSIPLADMAKSVQSFCQQGKIILPEQWIHSFSISIRNAIRQYDNQFNLLYGDHYNMKYTFEQWKRIMRTIAIIRSHLLKDLRKTEGRFGKLKFLFNFFKKSTQLHSNKITKQRR